MAATAPCGNTGPGRSLREYVVNDPELRPKRIIVVARPTLGRTIEALLRGAGYEVHRTPGCLDLPELTKRLRPQLLIVALDLPWTVRLDTLSLFAADKRPLPVLLLGDTAADLPLDCALRLPLVVDGAQLLESVHDLMGEDAVRCDAAAVR